MCSDTSEVSEHTQQLVDEEIRRIVDDAHEQVVALLRQNRDKLDSLAQALLEQETLDEDEAYAAAGVTRDASDPSRAAMDDRLGAGISEELRSGHGRGVHSQSRH